MTALKVIVVSLSFIIMLSIFAFSSQPAETSNDTSKNVIRRAIDVMPHTKNLSPAEKENIVARANESVRKNAHFFLYFCLGMTAFAACRLFMPAKPVPATWLWVMLFCTLLAACDEAYQLTVPGRSAQLSDILIDSAGALFGNFTATWIGSLAKRRSKAKSAG